MAGGRKIRFVIGGLVIAAVVASVGVYALKKNLVYYYSVADIREKGVSSGVRVSGQLVNGTVVRLASNELKFRIRDKERPASTLSVSFTGQVPDSFRDDPGVEVVVGGDYQGDGVFAASMLLTQCPSRYDAAREEAKKVRSNSTTLPSAGPATSPDAG